jgi:hypothetical protein
MDLIVRPGRYREYESLIDAALADFVASEGTGNGNARLCIGDFSDLLHKAADQEKGSVAQRSLGMLVAAGDYRKFVAMMVARSREESS